MKCNNTMVLDKICDCVWYNFTANNIETISFFFLSLFHFCQALFVFTDCYLQYIDGKNTSTKYMQKLT